MRRLDPVRDRHADLMPPEQRRHNRVRRILGRPGQTYQRAALQLSHRYGRRARQLRAGRHGQHHSLLSDRGDLDLAVADGGHAQRDRHAVIQQPCLTRRCAQFDELQIDLGKGPSKFRNEPRQHGVGQREHVTDRQSSPAPRGHRAGGLKTFSRQGQRFTRARQQGATGRRQLHSPRAAAKQRGSDFRFQFADLDRQWRLRHAQADGRPANAALFCDGNEIAETPEVHFCYTELVWVSCAMVLDGKSI